MAPDSELSQHWDEEQDAAGVEEQDAGVEEQDAGVEDEDAGVEEHGEVAGVEEVALEEAETDIPEEVHTLAELEKKIF